MLNVCACYLLHSLSTLMPCLTTTVDPQCVCEYEVRSCPRPLLLATYIFCSPLALLSHLYIHPPPPPGCAGRRQASRPVD